MRLFFAEFYKVWGKGTFLLSMCILLILNCFLLWVDAQPSQNSHPASAYRTLGAEIASMSEDEKYQHIQERFAAISAMSRIENILETEAYSPDIALYMREENRQILDDYFDTYQRGGYLHYTETLVQEYLFLKSIDAEARQIRGYAQFLQEIENKAESLSGISIFAADPYDQLNITTTAEVYRGMESIRTSFFPQRGFITAIRFVYSDAILLFMLLLIVSAVVREEKEGGLLGFIHAAPRGRLYTAAAKGIVILVSAFAGTALLYTVNLVYCHSLYDVGSLFRSVQSVYALIRSDWKINLVSYYIFFLLNKWLYAAVIGFLLSCVLYTSRSIYIAYGGVIAFIGANAALYYTIPGSGRLAAIKYANLFGLSKTNDYIGSYRNLYWFGAPLNGRILCWAVLAISFAGFFIAFVLLFCNLCVLKQNRALALPRRLQGLLRARPARIGFYEGYKLYVQQGAVAILLLLLCVQVYQGVTTRSNLGFDDFVYNEYLQQVQGPVNVQTQQWLLAEQERFKPIYEINVLQQAGAITYTEAEMYLSQLPVYEAELFERLVQHYKEINQYPGLYLMFSKGYGLLLGFVKFNAISELLVALLCVCLCFFQFFAVEYKTGMVKVVSATPLGKYHTAKAKLRHAFTVSAVLGMLSLLPRYIVVVREFGLPCLLAPAGSLVGMYPPSFKLPLVFLLALSTLARIFACYIAALVVLYFSIRLQKQIPALFASLAILCLPPVLVSYGFTALQWVTLYPLFQWPVLVKNSIGIVLGIFLLALAVCACVVGTRFIIMQYSYPRQLRETQP